MGGCTTDRLYIRNIFTAFIILLFIPQWSLAACGDSATLISTIQGNQAKSPLAGEVHTIEAIVTASFQANNELRGFFVQEETADQDDDADSSEGLFVFYQDDMVKAGQLVRVTGEIQERFGQTQMASVTELITCNGDGLTEPGATEIQLPINPDNSLESREGMLVKLEGKLVVTDHHNLGRFGEFVVSGINRLSIPTQVVDPGDDANELQRANNLNRILIDDYSNIQNPEPVIYPAPELSWHNTLRTGQKVKSITGVLAYAFGEYRIQPTQAVRFKQSNRRPDAPNFDDEDDDDAEGRDDDNVVIAAINVFNYFNGDGTGGGFPTSRGADSQTEFQRQSMKLGRAIGELNPAIIGVMELENDGYDDLSAIASLTDAVNSYAYDEYDYIKPSMDRLGNDVITVGLLYQPDKVTPVGEAMTLAIPPFDTLSRQPLAQVFKSKKTDLEFLVVVNHFKSKSCSGAKDADKDQGDGQGCYNATRVESATKLATWLETEFTIPHKIILGDLNSYARENPVQRLLEAGYYNELDDEDDYTFVFEGQAGVLDYALYTDSLRKIVKNVSAWHINADEPRVLDYNQEFKSATQWETFYHDDPYRSSDHDPVYLVLEPHDD